MNLLTSMGNCFYDSIPCVFLTGQINSRFLRPDPSIPANRVFNGHCRDGVAGHQICQDDPESRRRTGSSSKRPCGCVRRDDRDRCCSIYPSTCKKRWSTPNSSRASEPPAAMSFDLTVVDQQIARFISDLQQAERPVILVERRAPGPMHRTMYGPWAPVERTLFSDLERAGCDQFRL